jgi:two-component system response regulator RegX3
MRVAFLEDEPDVAATVCKWLREAGYEVECFSSGVECARAVESSRFDVCLLDWMVPDLSGLEVLARLQIKLRHAMPPVVFSTGRDSEEDVVGVLTAGADDYLVKPLSRPLLLARLQAVTRRQKGVAGASLRQDFGRLTVDHGRRQLAVDGRLIVLTERETDLALYLFQNIGRALSRERLIQVVWSLTPDIDTRTVDVHVSNLRRKLELTPESGWRLVSIYGHGYRLERERNSS